jgi:hypothetical protein
MYLPTYANINATLSLKEISKNIILSLETNNPPDT